MSDVDEPVSEASEIEESPTVEAGPSTSKGKGKGSSGKGKGKGGGQQGRSRATVVCAECKRLKLKCNREQPCNQCLPRNKVDKCIYSPEASQKVDCPNLNIRVKALERFVALLSAGVPVGAFTSTHQPAAEDSKKEIDEYLANGGELRPGTFAADQTSNTGHGDGTHAKGSLLSDLHELAHPYAHAILESEGISLDGFCTCDLPPTTSVTEGLAKVVVKEEEGREVLDVNMNPDVIPERKPRPPPKPGLSLPPISHFPDGMASLPPTQAYYQATKVIRTFYPASSEAKLAYVRSPDDTSPSAISSTVEPSLPLAKNDVASSVKPSVTLALVESLPSLPTCIDMLDRAQLILAESPVELGLRSRTAALPQELKDMFQSELNKPSGWVALNKRVKKCLSFWKEYKHRSSTRQRTVPAASSSASVPTNPQVPREPRHGHSRAGPSRAPDTASRAKARGSSPSKLDPRASQHEREHNKGKLPQSSTSAAQSPPAPALPPAYESLPFFAVICSLLAFGADPAKDQETSCVDSAPYLLALSQQALGLWVEGGEYIPPDRTGEVTEEVVTEARADYLRACSLAVQFYLNKTSPSVPASRRDGLSLGAYRHPNQRQLVNLASKMAAQLAAWDYEDGLVPVRDAEEGPLPTEITEEAKLVPRIAIAEGEEARLRLFWQVLCIAGMFQRDPFIPQSRCLAAVLPTLVPDYREMVVKVLGPSEDQDVSMVLAEKDPQSVPAGEQKPEAKERQEIDEERLRIERLFLVIRARITRLASVVNRRLSKGYSLGQAAELANGVQALFASVPAEFLWLWERAVEGTTAGLLANGETIESVATSPSTPTVTMSVKARGKTRAIDGNSNPKSSRLSLDYGGDGESQTVGLPQDLTASKLRIRMLNCELVLMAQLLVVRIYAPFAPKLTTPSGSQTVSEPLLNASKAIIRVAKLMHRPAQTYPGPSTFLAMCSLDQLVLDATLVCSRHYHGGTIIRSKDDKSGVQKKDAGSGELMQTIGIGLDLLDDVCTISRSADRAPSASTSSQGVAVANPAPTEAKVVASLRKQWTFKSASFSPAQGRKRTRSTMEGKTAATPAEPAKVPVTTQEELQPRSATEQQGVPSSETPADSQSKAPSPTPVDQHSPTLLPPTSTPTPAPPDGNAGDAQTVRMAAGDLKPRGKARAGNAPQISIRSRGPGGTTATSKRKQEKPQTPSQPLLTTVARAVKEDGRMGYVHEDRTPAASQRPLPPQPQSLPTQDTTQHPTHPPLVPQQPYGGYGSATSTQQSYNMPMTNFSSANQYPRTFDGGTPTGGALPPTPQAHQGYGGYANYPSQAAVHNSPYPQHHHPTYSAHPHSQPPMATPVPDDIAPDGYYNPQHGDNSGYGNAPPYGSSTGSEAYIKHGVPPSSYSALSYAPDPTTTSGSSIPNWQDPQTAQVPMQPPSSQRHFSSWQGHNPNDGWR